MIVLVLAAFMGVALGIMVNILYSRLVYQEKQDEVTNPSILQDEDLVSVTVERK